MIFCSPQDYQYYLEKLEFAAKENDCRIHAYIQMSNHVHLLVSPSTAGNLSKMMQTLGRYYVQYFNHHYKRTGTLWEGRYKSTLVGTDQYLFTLMRYIELNSVRAGIVQCPSEYPWSSYHCNALGKSSSLISPRFEYESLGNTPEERQERYQALFQLLIDKKTLTELRESTNKGWVFGNDKFKKEVEEQLARRVAPIARGGDRKSYKYKAMIAINRK